MLSKIETKLTRFTTLTTYIAFFIMAIASIVLIFSLEHYHTLDGPAHFYNANLIQSLLSGDRIIASWFSFNSSIIPNYSSYVVLKFFSSILPPSEAHKTFILAMTLLPPLLFLWLLKTLNFKSLFWALLLFPLSFSSALQYGFFNFSMGLILLLSYLIFLFKKKQFSFLTACLNALFLLALFYTHLYVFVVGLIFFSAFYFQKHILPKLNSKQGVLQFLKQPRLYFAVLSTLPALLLFIAFYKAHPSFDEHYLSFSELSTRLLDFSSIISFHYADESAYTQWIGIIILGFTLVGILLLIRNFSLTSSRIAFLVIALLLVVFYYTMPESVGYASFLSNRHQWYIYFFLLLFVSGVQLPKIVHWTLPVLFIFLHIQLLQIIYKYQQPFQQMITELYVLSEKLPDHSVIYPMNYAQTWESGHASNYLGIERPMVIMDNYETSQSYFPLIWDSLHPIVKLDTVCDENAKTPYYPIAEKNDSIVTPYYMAYSDTKTDWSSVCSIDGTKIEYQSDYVILFSLPQPKALVQY